MLEDDVPAQVFQAHPLQFVHDALLERQVILAGQRVRVVDVRDVRQDLQAIAAGRRDGRVGLRRGDEVDRRVGRQLALAEDGVEMLPLVLGEKEVVVRELRILAVEAEFEHEAGAGGLELLQRAHERLVLAQQLLVGGNDFHVRDDDVGGVERAVGDEAGDAAALLADFGDLAVEVDLDAEFVHQPLQAEGDVVEPAVHIPEVVAELDRRQAVHERRRVIRRRADVLDEVIEDVPHVARLEKPLHAAVHGAEQVELRKLPQAVELRELLGGVEALLEIAGVHQVVEVGGVFQEPLHVGGVFADLARLLGHPVGFAGTSTKEY